MGRQRYCYLREYQIEAKMSRCSICKFVIQPSDETKLCSDCNSAYHTVCWDSIEGCATYGCREAAVAEKSVTSRVISKGWGDEKNCPKCGAVIASSLLICSCGATFPWAEPMTKSEYLAFEQRKMKMKERRSTLIMLFIFTMFVLPAPITAPISGFYAFRLRTELAGENGAYLALGYGTVIIGLVYVLMFIALGIGL